MKARDVAIALLVVGVLLLLLEIAASIHIG